MTAKQPGQTLQRSWWAVHLSYKLRLPAPWCTPTNWLRSVSIPVMHHTLQRSKQALSQHTGNRSFPLSNLKHKLSRQQQVAPAAAMSCLFWKDRYWLQHQVLRCKLVILNITQWVSSGAAPACCCIPAFLLQLWSFFLNVWTQLCA